MQMSRHGGLNRILPDLPASAYKTYRILAPLATHYRPGTCEETDCGAWLHGWQTSVDETTELGQGQAHYIRHDHTRSHHERRTETGLTVFTFTPGQKCFRAHEHRVRLDRQERFLVCGGDWRGNPRGTPPREHTRPQDWQEDFAEHQARLLTAIERG